MVRFLLLAVLAIAAQFSAVSANATSVSANSANAIVPNGFARAMSTSTHVVLKDRTRIHVTVDQGEPGKSTFVLLNGLVWDVNRWDLVAADLNGRGHTVVRLAFRLQPESLRLLARGEKPKALTDGLTSADLAEDVRGVIQGLKIKSPVQLVGLSYGGAIAAEFASRYPKAVANTILMAPLVVPLDYYDPNGQFLRGWLNNVRFWENAACNTYGTWNPMLCTYRDYWYDSFYNYIYSSFLDQSVRNHPQDIDPVVYKKAVFHLVRAVRDFDLKAYVGKLPRVHMMVASRDDQHLLLDQVRVWDVIPNAQKKSLVLMVGTHHGMPVSAPVATSQWLDAIASGRPELQVGKVHKVRADR